MKIGYIGLGIMGKPCALNILKAGYPVNVWSRRPTKAIELVQHGATVSETIAELASNVSLLFINVGSTDDVEDVIFGENGVLAGAQSGLIIVDMSTISYTSTRRMAQKLAEKGIELVDAPVSGGSIGAEQGTLSIMVGCKKETFGYIQPILSIMGSNVTRIGESGSGQVAKSCNQILLTATMAGLGEAFRFARAADVDPASVRTALQYGFAASKVLDVHGERVLNGDFSPGFKTSLHYKDMGIVKEIAKELGLDLPLSNYSYSLLEMALNIGHADDDSSVIATLTESGRMCD